MIHGIPGNIEVVVASGKGGVGKSTITASLAILLSGKGHRLVAVDADAEAPNLNLVLGETMWDIVEPYYEGRYAYIIDELCINCGECVKACPFDAISVINERYVINKLICEGCYTCSFACPVKAIRYVRNIVAGHVRVKKETRYGFPLVSGEITPGRPNSGKLVTAVKNKAKEIGGPDAMILVDAAAGIGCQVISSLAGAHMVIMVAEPTPASFSDLRRLYRLSQHFGIPAALVINKADLDEAYADEMRKWALENRVDYLGEIPYDEKVALAIASMEPVVIRYPDSPASKAIVRIAEKVSSILGNLGDWRLRHLPEKIMPFKPIVIKPGGESVNTR